MKGKIFKVDTKSEAWCVDGKNTNQYQVGGHGQNPRDWRADGSVQMGGQGLHGPQGEGQRIPCSVLRRHSR